MHVHACFAENWMKGQTEKRLSSCHACTVFRVAHPTCSVSLALPTCPTYEGNYF